MHRSVPSPSFWWGANTVTKGAAALYAVPFSFGQDSRFSQHHSGHAVISTAGLRDPSGRYGQ